MFPEQQQERLLHSRRVVRILGLDVEARAARVAREHGIERRDLGPDVRGTRAVRVLGVEPTSHFAQAELGERALAQQPAARRAPTTRRAIERVVVEHHQHTIARDLEILLDPVGALFEREIPGGERVLGRVPRRAAVRDDRYAVFYARRKHKRGAERWYDEEDQ